MPKSPGDSVPERRLAPNQGRIAAGVFAAATLALLVIANLPYRYVERGGFWIGGSGDPTGGEPWEQARTPVMAGWPFRYSVAYRFDGWTESRSWSAWHLVGNGLVAAALATVVYRFSRFRARRIALSSVPARTRARFDVAVSLAICLVPVGLWAAYRLDAAGDRRWARQTATRGGCYLACWVPEPLAERLPRSLADSLARIRVVRLHQPDHDLVTAAAEVPTLVRLHLLGGRFDSDCFGPLGQRLHFTSCSINNASLSEAAIAPLGVCRGLLHLDLSGTDVDGEKLRRLDTLNRLRWIDLRDTPLKLAELGRPGWQISAERLELSRPRHGQSDRLVLDGWDRLQQLAVTRASLKLNAAPLELRLSNLPQLTRLIVNRAQKLALYAENLPRLRMITEIEDADFVMNAVAVNQGLPGLPWYSQLSLRNLPSLEALRCSAIDLETLVIRECPSLRHLRLGAFMLRSDGCAHLCPVPRDRCQSWIDELGSGQGAAHVDLVTLPLAGVSLKPLGDNPNIRRLGLAYTGVDFEQVKEVAAAGGVEQFQLGGCAVNAEQLTWLLDHCSRLSHVSADFSRVQFLELVDRPFLRALTSQPMQCVERMRLVDTPRLTASLHLIGAPQSIEIRNAPQLRGLAVEEPWPEQATLQGLRRLRWLAVGGPHAGDSIIDAIRNCRELSRLAIAYGNVSRERLAEVGRFPRLSSLELPGADVDDEVTESWQGLRYLRKVNLDDTRIGVGTLEWLSGVRSLRTLSLDRVQLGEAASGQLVKFSQLSELSLRDAAVSYGPLEELLSLGMLETLDLTGHTLTDELVAAAAGCPLLRNLIVSPQGLSGDAVRRLAEANPQLVIEWTAPPENLAAELQQEMRDRIARRALRRGGPSAGFEFDYVVRDVDGSLLTASVSSNLAVRGKIPFEHFRP